MKIVILDGYTANPGDLSWAGLEALGELTIYDRTPPYDEAAILKNIGDADIVYTNKTPISRSVLEKAPNIKFISILATGYNLVDVDAAKEKGIPVCNTPAYATAAVGQLVIALLLEICHHVGAHSDAVKAGRWASSPDFCFWDYPLIELSGKTLGIIGFGKIGQNVGRLAKALGMNVLAYNHRPKDTGKDIAEYVSLDELYAKSDVVSLHCPLFDSNKGMINKDSISKMKDGVIFINVSRGGLVNEQDLADALNSGKIYSAGVDVVSVEPIKPDNPLLTAKNCFITPHIAWAPKDARTRLLNTATDNLKAFIDGKPINVVNL